MDDKELVEVWQAEFEELVKVNFPTWALDKCNKFYFGALAEGAWQVFLIAKRSQPSVVLPEIQICRDSKDEAVRHLDFEDMAYSLTAAGIKYTVKE